MDQILADRSSREDFDIVYQALCKVRVEMLANFKDKNNGIILLSMAASDADDSDRISRQLQFIFARTKLGVYIVGRLPTTKLFQKIRKAILAENAVSDESELVCQTHGNITKVCFTDYIIDLTERYNCLFQLVQSISVELFYVDFIFDFKIFQVRAAIDIDKLHFGGCMMMCNQLLPCGHVCTKLCHTPVYPHADCDCGDN